MCKILENLDRMWKGKVGWAFHEDEYNEGVKGLLMEVKKVLEVKIEEELEAENEVESEEVREIGILMDKELGEIKRQQEKVIEDKVETDDKVLEDE